MTNEMRENRKKFKTKILQLFIFLFLVVVPLSLLFYRHGKMTQKIPTWVLIVSLVIVIWLVKKRNHKYKILESKEIEDDNRTVKVILYFYKQFAILYIVVMIAFKYVQLNFVSISWTMVYIGISLALGGLLRIHLANTTGL